MTIELLIARAMGGKTQTCIERIRAVKQDDALAQVWVLVPNPQAAAQFKARLAEAGGGMGVSVGEFRYFYKELFEENGVFTPIISSALSHRLIQETVREAFDSGELIHYAAIKDKPGFITVLRDAFAELRSAMVHPQSFLDYTNDATPARRELAILYQRFLNKLNEIGWNDSEGQAWLAIKALEADHALASRFSLVIVDGFTAFTAAQRQFLKLLAQQAGEILITLTGARTSGRVVYRRSQKVLDDLRADLSLEINDAPIGRDGVATTPHTFLPQPIQHMERHIFETGAVEQLDLTEPILLEARSQAEEAREALRWIKRLHVRQGIPLNACAIYCSDLQTYQPLLRAAANEFGVNIHFSQRDPLAGSPAILALLNLLNLPLEDYLIRSLLNAFHSPYFDFSLENQDIEDLEKVALEAVIVNGRGQWDDAWKMLEAKRQYLAEDLDEERSRPSLTDGIDLQALKARLDRFWERFEQIGATCSQTDWIDWLEARLNKLGFYENISTERDQAACKALGEVLRAMVVTEKVLGPGEVDYAQFLADLQAGLKGAGLEDDRATRQNAVFAGKLVEARATRYLAVALLGFSEGLFPVVENPDPFLDEELRHDLGLDQRLQRDQESTFYQAFTRADTHLLMTRPYLSEDGERWEPSPYWQATTRLFTKSAVVRIQRTDDRAQSEAASPQELLFWSVQQGKLDINENEELKTRRKNLDNSHVILDARRAKHARGTYEGDLSQISVLLADRFSKEQVWSASRLEAYSDCPYRFFTNAVLNLEKPELPEPWLDIRQIGSLYHRILELVYTEAAENNADPLEIVDQVAERVFRTAPEDFGFRPTALWEVEKSQHLENLHLSLEAMEEERGGWQPFAFEKKFGIKGIPFLELEKNGEAVRLRGIIDRVDKNADGEIRVVDYKTGGSMSNKDLVDGPRLQLPIYAAAAELTLNLGEVADGFYWAINAAKVSSLTLAKFKSE